MTNLSETTVAECVGTFFEHLASVKFHKVRYVHDNHRTMIVDDDLGAAMGCFSKSVAEESLAVKTMSLKNL